MILAFAATIFFLCLKQVLFETDHVIAIKRWQRRTANPAMRLTDCRGNDGIMQSVRDDRDRLSFGNDVVELHKKRCDLAAHRRKHRDLHLHRFDHHNLIAIRNGSSNLHGSCADASGDLGDDLNFWHAIAFLLWSQNA
ncbi:hypothetical protein ABIB68_000541 [Bradyrhizobium sp. F1.2.2]